MAAASHPLVGIDTLRYYWQHKGPEQSAADLSRLMQRDPRGHTPVGAALTAIFRG
ncbi:hypothetical protein PSEUDO8O_70237 [Pseudomonas sp. 8O]|nr:hypothetical protein PSEUDO8O_70237 [Pseudomonas sp. 8O]